DSIAALVAGGRVLRGTAALLGNLALCRAGHYVYDALAFHDVFLVSTARNAPSSWRNNFPSFTRARCKRDLIVPSYQPVISPISANEYPSTSCNASSTRCSLSRRRHAQSSRGRATSASVCSIGPGPSCANTSCATVSSELTCVRS